MARGSRNTNPGSGADRPTFTDLATNVTRGVLINSRDPGDRLDVLLNPTTLSISVEAEIGELNPIGASHTTQQYAHTKSMSTTLVYYLSSQAAHVYNNDLYLDIRNAIDWISRFTIPWDEYIAPPLLIVIWPRTLVKTFAVRSFRAHYIRWYADGTPRIARVTLNVVEKRYEPRYGEKFNSYGWATRDDAQMGGGSRGFYKPIVGKAK